MELSETLELYFEKTAEFAKATEPLLVPASNLKNLVEWQACREVLMTKIAKDSIDALRSEAAINPLQQGRIQGMYFVVDLVEKYFGEAIEKKKALLLKKSQKDNSLTTPQA